MQEVRCAVPFILCQVRWSNRPLHKFSTILDYLWSSFLVWGNLKDDILSASYRYSLLKYRVCRIVTTYLSYRSLSAGSSTFHNTMYPHFSATASMVQSLLQDLTESALGSCLVCFTGSSTSSNSSCSYSDDHAIAKKEITGAFL